MFNSFKNVESDTGMQLVPEIEDLLTVNSNYRINRETIQYENVNPRSIWLNNTDLNAPYFGGNFNFLYNGGSPEALVTFNTFFSFRKNFPEVDKQKLRQHLLQAGNVWDSAAEVQVRNVNGAFNDKIKLRFKVAFVKDSRHANKKTDVHPNGTRSTWLLDKGRESVMRELNVFIGSSRNVLVHELGHVWGLMDEYKDRWVSMKLSLGHVGPNSPLINDKISVMNEGFFDEVTNTGEFRTRFFMHFGREILKSFLGLKNYTVPITHNGRVISSTVYGRVALLKKNIAGDPPNANDVLPFNPQYTRIQVSKRG